MRVIYTKVGNLIMRQLSEAFYSEDLSISHSILARTWSSSIDTGFFAYRRPFDRAINRFNVLWTSQFRSAQTTNFNVYQICMKVENSRIIQDFNILLGFFSKYVYMGMCLTIAV